jgi:hypothetical protein
MEPIVLTDKSVVPGEEQVFAIIGDKRLLWKKIMDYLYAKHSGISEEWKYYNDGKSWLFRSVQKRKTIFWIGVLKDSFRVTFWFGNKAEPILEQSDLPESIKSDFRNAKRYNVLRSVSVQMNDQQDADNVIKLIELKMKIK